MVREPLTFTFKIRGMDCVEEVALLKREVGPIIGEWFEASTVSAESRLSDQ